MPDEDAHWQTDNQCLRLWSDRKTIHQHRRTRNLLSLKHFFELHTHSSGSKLLLFGKSSSFAFHMNNTKYENGEVSRRLLYGNVSISLLLASHCGACRRAVVRLLVG